MLMLTMVMSWGFSFFVSTVNANALDAEVDLDQGNIGDIKTNTTAFANEALGTTGEGASLQQMVANVIKFVLALLGMVVMVIVVYSGFLWMTAGGNVENVDKAKKLLKNAIIGLILIFAAYAIADFAVVNIANITSSSN